VKSNKSPASLLVRLLDRAKRSGEDYNILLNRFGLERLLDRLARSRHADRFLLKGAMLFSLWYDQPHRPTRDADLLGFGPDSIENLIATFREVAEIELGDGIVFDGGSVRAEPIREDNIGDPGRSGRDEGDGHMGSGPLGMGLRLGLGAGRVAVRA
jgi:hypothetical protein